MFELRGVKPTTDQVSALMIISKQCFQLEPEFRHCEQTSEHNNRNRFKCTVSFLGCPIVAALGQNKAESKRVVAKLALWQVAPGIFEELFEGERPPIDVLEIASFTNESKIESPTEKPDSTLTLGCPELE